MPSRHCRLLPIIQEVGVFQMAADESLLATAASTGVASLRFYRWSEPTVSLGYFQPQSVRFDRAGLSSMPWLRRATGGATLVHDQELTYSLAIPATPDWQPRGMAWIPRFHRILVSALAALGVQTDICEPSAEKKLGPVLCFLHQTPGDILCGSHKIVGSAQRKQRGALLQHGGILLSQSRFTPELPGIFELTGQRPTRDALIRSVAVEFARDLDCLLIDDDWTDEERRRCGDLIISRYANTAWNEKR